MANTIDSRLKFPGIHGAVLTKRSNGTMTVIMYGEGATLEEACDKANEIGTAVGYTVNRAVVRPLEKAIAWLEANPDQSMRAAAREFGISAAAISRALKEGTGETCPCCGQRLPKTSSPEASS